MLPVSTYYYTHFGLFVKSALRRGTLPLTNYVISISIEGMSNEKVLKNDIAYILGITRQYFYMLGRDGVLSSGDITVSELQTIVSEFVKIKQMRLDKEKEQIERRLKIIQQRYTPKLEVTM